MLRPLTLLSYSFAIYSRYLSKNINMKHFYSRYFCKTEAHLRGEEKEPNLMRLDEILIEEQATDQDTHQMKVIMTKITLHD